METSVATENFVTVVSVGNEVPPVENTTFPADINGSGYVTVLTIGESDPNKDVTEEVLVYRLPGERLGFGLKFEGGTKASEFVKRLFIQSCAADSPASRVKSSWGKLTEGDEVLDIDGIPVNSMTRIDCVRCLKDSNVVIKLLVKHSAVENKQNAQKPRSVEDIPLVISAEKKRIPPPPPPVPPRKIPRKFMKNNFHENKENLQEINNNPIPNSRHIISDSSTKVKKFQSPRSSGRSSYSPDIPRRDRRFSDGSLGPPDAEVYINLISQESTQSLSESDDTASTISTVIDRFGSFPTTTTSSIAGSLPSTPTLVQKQLDLSNLLSFEDEDITIIKNLTNNLAPNKEEHEKIQNGEDGVPLQPPSCFQDAPLSYGNEDMRVIDTKTDRTNTNEQIKKVEVNDQTKISKKPPVPPRSRDNINCSEKDKDKDLNVHDENMNISSLPRLVDFLPKSTTKESIEVMKLFLENERRDTNFNEDDYNDVDMYNDDVDVYSTKWCISPQLTTIGEVEEEGQEPNFNRATVKTAPIVIVENADTAKPILNDIKKQENKKDSATMLSHKKSLSDIDGSMDTPPSDSRQPPDGHEFPDYIESNKLGNNRFDMSYNSVDTGHKVYKSVECIKLSTDNNCLNDYGQVTLKKSTSISNNDLTNIGRPSSFDTNDDIKFKSVQEPTNLHTRSQSLIDMSALSKQKNYKWNMMVEQRKKGLSKLKGLVIPENIAETEIIPAINIPEIKSQTVANVLTMDILDDYPPTQINSNSYIEYTKSTPWSSQNTIPKYSPAFKRKSIQVYPTMPTQKEKTKPTKLEVDENFSDPPKSLESITSPTRSDYSFDYVSSSKKGIKNEFKRVINRLYKDIGKSEDESDNDSAVSSSQSSYISRCSPPASPTINDYENMHLKSEEYNSHCRLLKPSSVEAINRKNILASAKCRSGRDLKVGSPVIQRKYDESESKIKPTDTDNNIVDKVNTTFSQVERSTMEIETVVEKPVVQTVIKDVTIPLPNGTSTPIKTANYSNSTAQKNIEKDIPKTLPTTLPKTTPHRSIPEPSLIKLKEPPKELYRTEYKATSILYKAPPLSVNALKKNFENFGPSSQITSQKVPTTKPVMNMTKQVKSEIAKTENKINQHNILVEKTTKKTSEIKKIPEEPLPRINIPKRTSITKEHGKQKKVVLKCNKEVSLGITLAGGEDCENKEVTIHRIRYGSVAYEDGRLKRGDKIIAINGEPTKGMKHDETIKLLKESTSECSIMIEESDISPAPSTTKRLSSALSSPELKCPTIKSVTNVISLNKDGDAGLGFSIEGGKDSPQGDVPLLIKKIFQGGAADKSGQLQVGDEILSINDMSFVSYSRIEAWNLMKKLPDGKVTLCIHR